MTSTNNNIQLLIDLGVNRDSSKENINRYIRELKNLENVKVSLEVDGLKQSQKGFNDTQKEIESLQKYVKDLEREVSELSKAFIDTGKSINSNKINKELDSVKEKANQAVDVMDKFKGLSLSKPFEKLNKNVIESFRDIDELYSYFDKKQIRFKIHENAKGDVTKVVTQIRNELDEIETLTIRPKFNKKTEDYKFKVSSVLDDISTSQLNENIQKSLDKLKDLARQGNLTGEQVEKYIGKLSFAETNTEIAKITKEFSDLGKEMKDLNKEANRLSKVDNEVDKLSNSIEKLRSQGSLSKSQADSFLVDLKSVERTTDAVKKLENQINQVANSTNSSTKIKNAMDNISPTVDRLNEKLELTINKLGGNVDANALEKIRKELQLISNTDIKTTDEIAKLNNQISQAEKSITQLTTSANHMNRFDDSVRKVNEALTKLERTGYSTGDTINEFRTSLNNIPTGDLAKVRELLNRVNNEMDNVSHANKMAKAIEQASNNLEKVQSQLDKTKNLYRRTFDRREADEVAEAIERVRNLMSNLPKNASAITQRDIDLLNSGINQANTQVRQFNANATTATRNGLSMLESLKVAFEKFPVWIK